MFTMDQFVNKEKQRPITDSEIRQLVTRPIKIRNVSGLTHKDSPASLCPKVGDGCVLFWQTPKGEMGHFDLLLRHHDHYEFFDSYGMDPLQVANKTTHDSGKKCMDLFKGHNVKIGRHKFQRKKDDINTCGRFCAFRFNCHAFTYEEFKKLMHFRGVAPDDLITLLTISVDFEHINKKGKK